MAAQRHKKKQHTPQNILFQPPVQTLKESWSTQFKRLKKRSPFFPGVRVIGQGEGVEGSLAQKLEDMGAVKKDEFSMSHHMFCHREPGRTLDIDIADTGSGAYVMVMEETREKQNSIDGFLSPQKLSELMSTLKELEQKMPQSPKDERALERAGVTIYDLGGIHIRTDEILSDRYFDLLETKKLLDFGRASPFNLPDPRLFDYRNPLVESSITISSKKVEDRFQVEGILHDLGFWVPPSPRMPGSHSHGVVNVFDEPVKKTTVDLTQEKNFRKLMKIIKGEG